MELSHQRDDVVTNASAGPSHPEGVDRGTHLGDNLIGLAHLLLQPGSYVRRNPGSQALEGQSHAKEALDHMIVQVTSQAITVVMDGGNLDLLVEPGVFNSDTGGQGQCFDESHIVVVNSDQPILSVR